MFAFTDSKQRDAFLTLLSRLGSPSTSSPARSNTTMERLTKRWLDGDSTNFEYLMHLNKHSGRTFNDLMQYPIFPFILSDYESSKIDLRNRNIYRVLCKPISVQDESKEKQYQENYAALEHELNQSKEKASCGSGLGPYHYGSHYSSSGIVLHFLVRLQPFTEMSLSYQDGSFDLPDRMFHNMSTSWHLASKGSSTDVKELIPELFYLPEAFVNLDGLKFGVRQNGDVVDNVVFPQYCDKDPRLFVRVHRQALESDHVRENLCDWIDLIFGFKQSGKPALEAINVFHPATYYGFDLNSIKDPVQREARRTMIKMYGQTPKQLFTKPHPRPVKLYNEQKRLADSSETKQTKPWSRARSRSPARLPQDDFATYSYTIPKVIDQVEGLKWGYYVGMNYIYNLSQKTQCHIPILC